MVESRKPGRPAGPQRKNVTFRLRQDLYDECQECCRIHERVTLTEVVEAYLTEWIEAQRKKHKVEKFEAPAK